MTLRGTRVVVFDIDDTLFLERDYVRSGFEHVGSWLLAERGVEGFADHAWSLFEAGVRGTIFDRTLEALRASAERALVQELVARYRAHTPRIRLLPDAEGALRDLSATRALAAVSDGPLESQTAKVRALGLGRLLSPVVLTGAYPAGQGKPHPRAFREVEAAHGARGPECVYVADNPAKDFAGPRALGWRTVRIRRPLGLYRELPHGDEVESVLPDLAGLAALLG